MEKLKIEMHCCLCTNKCEEKIDMPEGWGELYSSVSSETGFCPDHNSAKGFTENCPGCVEGFGDCELFKSFAFKDFALTDKDLDMIRAGKCPKRTNGTFVFDGGTLQDINIGGRSDQKVGEAMAEAILKYRERF